MGVADDGTILGLPAALDPAWRDDFASRILGACREIKPPVHPVVQWAVHQGKVVAVVSVGKGFEPIYYATEKPYVRRGGISRPAEPSEVEHVFRMRYAIGQGSKPSALTREIAMRMKSVLGLMNANRMDALTVPDLARAMNLGSPAELDEVLDGRAPSSFAMIDQFCERFAVNKEWLSTGRAAPFASTIPFEPLPETYLRLINEAKPECVYLVRSNSRTGETCIVIETDTMHAWTLPDMWHVSDEVGGGGSRDLLSLYDLFKHWIKSTREYNVLGRVVEPGVTQGIANGRVFPGIVRGMRLSHWWDDLTDIEHKWTTRQGSSKAYGQSFVAAQDIIRAMHSKRERA